MKTQLKAVPKVALGLLFASGLAGLLAANARSAQACVVVSVGVGGAYAAPYHWYRWRDRMVGIANGFASAGFLPSLTLTAPAMRTDRTAPMGYDGSDYAPGYVRREWDGDRRRNWDRDRPERDGDRDRDARRR